MASIDEEFFAAFAAAFGPLRTVHTVVTPSEMMTGPVSEDGWVEWRLRPCEVSLEDVFTRYAKAAGKPLPPSFRRWYASTFTLDGDCSVVRLPANPSNAPGEPLLEYIMPGNPWWERPLALGLLPFGDEANDAGPLCFDTRSGDDPDRWPVTFWDHDGRPEIGPVLFSSFDALLRGCTAYMRDSGDSIGALMAADPQGAGSSGARYWERFRSTTAGAGGAGQRSRSRVSYMKIAAILAMICAAVLLLLLTQGKK